MASITGTNGNDSGARTLNGTGLADEIYGLAGNDILIGFGGDDVLEGAAGADELFGSDGFDFASYTSSNAGVRVDLATFYFSGGHAEGDQLYGIESVIGSAYGDELFGNQGRNVLRGEGGNDGLYAGEGNDQLYGGAGNDRLYDDAGDDEMHGGAGLDTAVFAYANGVVADLAKGTANGASSGSDRLFGIENLIGSQLGDQLLGNSGANVLTGGFGADVLTGRGGVDRFDFDFQNESNPKVPDLILDLSRSQGDKIDLRDIDAKVNTGGNQTFNFIGQAQFTAEGQVRFYQQNGDTFIEANTDNAVPGADMVIVLDTLVSVRGTDFLL